MAVLASAQVNITYVHDDAHFWSDAEGAHVTYTEEGDTIGGGNVLIDTDSIKVRNGYTVLAEFGADGAIIGQNNDQKITITNDTFTAVNADGSKAAVIKSNYGTSEHKVTETLVGSELSYTPVTGTVITAETWTSSSKVEFTAGTPATKTINGEGSYRILLQPDRKNRYNNGGSHKGYCHNLLGCELHQRL